MKKQDEHLKDVCQELSKQLELIAKKKTILVERQIPNDQIEAANNLLVGSKTMLESKSSVLLTQNTLTHFSNQIKAINLALNRTTNIDNYQPGYDNQWDTAYNTLISLYREISNIPDLLDQNKISFLKGQTEQLNSYINEAEKAKNAIEKNLEESKRLLSLQTEKYLSGDFIKNAGKELTSYRWHKYLAMAVILTGIIVTALVIDYFKSDASISNVFAEILFRIGVIGFISFLAIYLMRLAGAHRQEFFRNREISTKLNALEPFLKDIDDLNAKADIRKIAAEQIFKIPG